MTITVEEFLSGEPLEYRGFDRRRVLTATYQIGVGIVVTDKSGAQVAFVTEAIDDQSARRAYHNLTRNGE